MPMTPHWSAFIFLATVTVLLYMWRQKRDNTKKMMLEEAEKEEIWLSLLCHPASNDGLHGTAEKCY